MANRDSGLLHIRQACFVIFFLILIVCLYSIFLEHIYNVSIFKDKKTLRIEPGLDNAGIIDFKEKKSWYFWF